MAFITHKSFCERTDLTNLEIHTLLKYEIVLFSEFFMNILFDNQFLVKHTLKVKKFINIKNLF